MNIESFQDIVDELEEIRGLMIKGQFRMARERLDDLLLYLMEGPDNVS